MFILKVCDNSSLLNTILFIKNIINIIFIVVPIILALLFSIDLAKNVFSKDDNDNQKNLRLGIKRIIYSLILLLVPTIIEAFMNMIDNYSKVADCYTIATEEKVLDLKEKEDAEYEKMRKEQQEKREEQQKIVAEEDKQAKLAATEAEKQARKEAEERAKEKEDTGTGSSVLDLSGVSSGAEKIAKTAEYLAWPYKTSKSKVSYTYGKKTNITKWSQLTKGKPTKAFMEAMDRVYPTHFKWKTGHPVIRPGASCDTFVGVTVKASGYDKLGKTMGEVESSLNSHTNKWKRVKTPKRGDVCQDSKHIKIYLGNGKVAQASYNGFFGKIDKGSCKSSVRIWRATK